MELLYGLLPLCASDAHSFTDYLNDINSRKEDGKKPHWLRNKKCRTWRHSDAVAKQKRVAKRRAKRKAA